MNPSIVSLEVLDEVMPYMFPAIHPIDKDVGEKPEDKVKSESEENPEGGEPIKSYMSWYYGEQNVTDMPVKNLQNFKWFLKVLEYCYWFWNGFRNNKSDPKLPYGASQLDLKTKKCIEGKCILSSMREVPDYKSSDLPDADEKPSC